MKNAELTENKGIKSYVKKNAYCTLQVILFNSQSSSLFFYFLLVWLYPFHIDADENEQISIFSRINLVASVHNYRHQTIDMSGWLTPFRVRRKLWVRRILWVLFSVTLYTVALIMEEDLKWYLCKASPANKWNRYLRINENMAAAVNIPEQVHPPNYDFG